jgi:hypothetical protein
MALGLITAGDQALSVNDGGIPQFYLKSKRPLNEAQAEGDPAEVDGATAQRGGAPPVCRRTSTPRAVDQPGRPGAARDAGVQRARDRDRVRGAVVLLNMALQGGLTYQNPAALGEMWWRFELRPTATRIANALSAQMLPRGQWVSFRAEDTFAALTDQSTTDDEQAALDQTDRRAAGAQASPSQQSGRLTAVTG